LLGTLGQRPHFIGHYRKATALLTRTGSLDGRVQGQQVGLLRHAFDHAQHSANVLDFGTEALDARTGIVTGSGQQLDALQTLAHHLLTAVDLVIRGLRGLRGLFSVARHIVHRGGHLVHSSGHLLGFLLLAADLDIGLLGHAGERLRRAGQLLDTGLQAADHLAQAVAHLLHRLHQLADFITTTDLHTPAQIPGGNLLRHRDHTAQRRDDQTGNHPRCNQPHQQSQGRRADDQHRVFFQLCLHRQVFGVIGLVDPADHQSRPVMQLFVDHFFLGQQAGVFTQLLAERGNVP